MATGAALMLRSLAASIASPPRAERSVAIAVAGSASGSIASCSWPKLRDVSSPTMSGRVAIVCPTLQNTGPSLLSSARSVAPSSLPARQTRNAASPTPPIRPNTSH